MKVSSKTLLAGLLLLNLAAAPAAALVIPAPPEAATETAAPAPATEQQITDTPDDGADERIAQRIRAIFAELPALSGTEVAVNAGVVTLSGTVAEAGDIERAERIASRVSGVVTVENLLERDVSVDGNLDKIGGIAGKFNAFVAMLPLIGAALAVALIIGLIGYLIAGLSNLWHRIAPNSFLAGLIASAIRFAFVVGGVVVALDMIGATALLGAVLGGAGVVGIALGFAMRDTIENYVASLMLSLRQPFRANDHVLIDDKEGRVIRLTSRATILMTLDGNHLRIPNSAVFKAVILNYTRNPQRRFEFDLGIDADDDPTAARHLGAETLRALPFVLDTPEATGRVIEVGDSNIVLRFLGWIDQTETDWFKAKSRAIPAVKDALESAGFLLPEPIYRLKIDPGMQLPNGAKLGELPPERREGATCDVPDEQAADTSPEDEVKRMVDAERADASSGSEKDLLDSGKPVE